MALNCKNVVLKQGDFSLQADVEFQLGMVTALIGPSGAGKSTFLSALAGFLEPQAGHILWGGQELQGRQPGDRPISMLFQDNNLFPHLSIAQNVGLGLRKGLRFSPQEYVRIDQVLESVGLKEYHDRKPGDLSGGQQSRAALARVLIADRQIVLLDEPFAALGPRLKDEMLDLVKTRLADQGRCVVMVTHDPEDAQRIAQAVALVADGVVARPVETTNIFKAPPPALAAYLGV